MPISINHNPSASLAVYNVSNSSLNLKRSLEKLSSGSRINTSFDDAGGLAVSMKLSASVRRTDAAIANINNAISFLQTQDGALAVADKLLNRMSELTSMAMDVTKSTDDINLYQTELEGLQSQLYSLLGEEFNGTQLFGPTAGKIIGDNPLVLTPSIFVVTSQDGKQSIGIAKSDLAAVSYTIGGTPAHAPGDVQMKFDNSTNIQASLDIAKSGIEKLGVLRANNGAQQSQLTAALSVLEENKVNLQVANGRIQDVDIAEESTSLARLDIRHKAATAMLAQANQGHQVLLRLLG
jgi:flagellin